MTGQVTIYGLYSTDGIIRYVGQTKRLLRQRLNQHIFDSKTRKTLPVHCWINKHYPYIFISAIQANAIKDIDEIKWISFYQNEGNDLLNLTPGGTSDQYQNYICKKRTKECIVCDNIFEPKNHPQVYCSDFCRFYSKTKEENGCLIWTGQCNNWGFPMLRIGSSVDNTRKKISARKFIWESKNGTIKENTIIKSTCGNRICVNIDHLITRKRKYETLGVL